MGVDRLPSGSYRARLMVDGQSYAATFSTEREADEWLVVTRGRVVGERALHKLAVEQHARRWLGEFVDTAAGVDRYRRDVDEHILPALGSRALVEVTASEITALVEQVRAATSPAVAVQVLGTVEELFADAVDDGTTARSPVPASWRAAASSATSDIY